MKAAHLIFHGLAIKRHASPAAVADLIGMAEDEVVAILAQAAAAGRVTEAQGGYALAPLTRVALDGYYSRYFAALRADPDFESAYQRFEVINRGLKQVITDWQTMEVGGQRVANDHSDSDHDARIIDRLGDIHDQIDPVLKALARGLPRLAIYHRKLTEALEQAEDGDVEWVSDIRRESYHTVWFELHEELLRIVGETREE